MTRAGDAHQPGIGYRRGEASSKLREQPFVALTPEYERRGRDLAVTRFDLERVVLVELRHLAVIGGLADRPEPRSQIGFQVSVAHLAGDRSTKVRGDHLTVNMLGHRLKRLEVILHMARKGRNPRRDRDGVAQRDSAKAPSLEQHQSERDCRTKVVTGDAWLL